jgi:hypothetical protein
VLINEIAWAGTTASAYDEWIELHNPGSSSIDITGWELTDGGDINVILTGSIPAYSFYLLERTDDTTIDDIDADKIYSGNLKNTGEALRLKDPSGALIDSANIDGSGWPAGDTTTRASMERRGGSDIPGNWGTFTGYGGNGHDIDGNPIRGTPRQPNSLFASTPTATPSPTAQIAPRTPYPPQAVLINEVAWAGTSASSSDEWIELHNTGSETIDLTGWRLTDGGDINIVLDDLLPPFSFYLLERTDDSTVSDISADRVYSGNLNNRGETLLLKDPHDNVVDSANGDGGGWPAGDNDPPASMERRGGKDIPGNWGTFTGYHGVGRDADGNRIRGTPRTTNSLFFPTPAPTWIPGKVVINEVLMKPHYDWQGIGGVDTNDEYIELYNIGPSSVNLKGWILDDIPDGGSSPFTLPARLLRSGEYTTFFKTKTRIALNDSGDTVRLLAPNGRLLDEIQYLKIRAYNLSFGRLPDGSGHLFYGLWPTPGGPNILFIEPLPEPYFESVQGRPLLRPRRLGRHPSRISRLHALGHTFPMSPVVIAKKPNTNSDEPGW